MKIGIDAHCLEGNRTGVGRYLSAILDQWKISSVEHDFFLYFKDEIPKNLPLNYKYFHLRLLPHVLGKRSTALFMHISIPKASIKDKPDIMFFPEYIAPIIITKPFVLTLHDIVYAARPDLHFWPSKLDHILLTQVSKFAAHRAKTILVPSNFVKEEIIRIWHINKNKIIVTPEACSKEFKPVLDTNLLKQVKNSYDIKESFFIFVGSAFRRRHVRECMEAFFSIAIEYTQYQFLIAGTDRYNSKDELNNLAESLNKALKRKAFIRKDFIQSEDLPSLYSAASATIWLSSYEGFGLPLLESLACGTPVITNKTASIPEVVGECAIFVEDISDSKMIAKAMLKIIEGKAIANQLKMCSIKQTQNFSWEKCARQTLDALLAAGCTS